MKKIILGTLCAFALNTAGLSLAMAEDKPAADAAAEKPAKKKGKKAAPKAEGEKKEEGAKKAEK